MFELETTRDLFWAMKSLLSTKERIEFLNFLAIFQKCKETEKDIKQREQASFYTY